MPFLPDSPFTIAYALILGAAVLSCLALGPRSIRMIALFMVLNWLGTRSVTAWGGDLTAIFAALVDGGSAVALLVFVRTTLSKAIAALFALMLICYGAHDLGYLGREQMWAFADLFAYLQILLMVGGGIGTHLRSRGLGGAHYPARRGDLRGSVALRSEAAGFAEIDPEIGAVLRDRPAKPH